MKRMFTVLAMVLAALSISFMACSVSSSDDDSPFIKKVQFTKTTEENLNGLTETSSTIALEAEYVYSDGTVKTIETGVDTQVFFTIMEGDAYAEIISENNIHKLQVKKAGTVRLQVRYLKLTDEFTFTITANGVVNAETPIIRTGLAGGTYTVGDKATALTVTATVTDGGELSYKWYKGDEEISGATSNSYTPSTEAAGTFTYKVVVTNTNNSVNGKTTATAESSATVIVNDIVIKNAEKPTISKGLADGTYTVGAKATELSVEATVSDGGTLTYQWYKGEELIEGATSASYTPDTTTAGKITYKVVVTNTNNNVNGKTTDTAESSATVIVNDIVIKNAEKPTIKTGLADGTYTVGAKATELSVEATVSDGGTLTYQWYKGEELIEGATSASYTPDTTTAGKITYKVVVTNTNNNVNGKTTDTADSSATVTVKSTDPVVVGDAEKPTIKTGLADGTYTVGAKATALTVTATVTDGGELSYKWYKGDEEISGATSNSYTPSTEAAGTFTYKVVVTNTNNSVNGEKTATAESSATVTVNAVNSTGNGGISIDFN